MKKFLFLLVFIVIERVSIAQVLSPGLLPLPGDIYQFYNIDTNSAWSIANDSSNIWDFNSNTDIGAWSYICYIQPSQTPYDTVFANDNLVSTTDFYSFNFYHSTSDSLVNIGIHDTSRVIKYLDGFKILTLPFALDSSFEDTCYSSFFYSSGFYQTFNSKTVNYCHKLGTLLLNGMTFNNVLLIRSSQRIVYTYYANGIPAYFTTQLGEQFTWYDGITKFPLLDYYYLKANNSWESFWTENAYYLRRRKDLTTDITSMVNSNNSNSYYFDNSKILHNNTNSIIKIIDLSGRVLEMSSSNEIDLSTLSSGVYFISTLDTTRVLDAQKIIIK